MIVYVYNKDQKAVKKSFNWLADLVMGGSDQTSNKEELKRLVRGGEFRSVFEEEEFVEDELAKSAKLDSENLE